MLESLYFSIGGFFNGRKEIKIWNQDGKFWASYQGDFNDLENEYTKEISEEEAVKLENKLKKCDVNNWLDEYVDHCVMDGTQWELKIKEFGKEAKKIYGSNEYPKSWKSFIKALNAIIPEVK